jgi:hypothetical protein
MQEQIIPRKIDEYKPDMKALDHIKDVLPFLQKGTVLMAKVDGEFTRSFHRLKMMTRALKNQLGFRKMA